MNEHDEQASESGERDFRVEDSSIIFAGGERVSFPFPVAEALAFGEQIVVVRLDVSPGHIFNENVYALTRDGRMLWQVPARSYVYADSPYVNLARSKEGEMVILTSWDGTELTLDLFTGRILRETQSR